MKVEIVPAALVYEAKPELAEAIGRAEQCWTALVDGQIAAVWGIEKPTLISGKVYLWLWAMPLAFKNKFTFLRLSRAFVRELVSRYDEVHGLVACDFEASIEWLRWLGFKVGPREGIVRPFMQERN